MTKPTKKSDHEWVQYADAMRRRRIALGMTILELSADTGIAESSISYMERGVVMPRIRTLIAWRRGLRLSPMPRQDWE